MIQINLLPLRFRQIDSTPAKIGISVIVGIVLVLGLLTVLAISYIKTNDLEAKVQNITSDITSLEKNIVKLQKVQALWAIQEKRRETVKKLFLSRMIVAPRLARLQELVPENIQIKDLAFETVAKRDRKGVAALERSISLGGFVRVPYNDQHFFHDKQRMTILSAFVKALQGDEVFYAGCTGDIDYVKAVTKEFIDDFYFYPGEIEPEEKKTVPVFAFGIKATSNFSEAGAK